jgi:hypothetical protein
MFVKLLREGSLRLREQRVSDGMVMRWKRGFAAACCALFNFVDLGWGGGVAQLGILKGNKGGDIEKFQSRQNPKANDEMSA